MKASIILPFGGTDEHRAELFAFVRERWTMDFGLDEFELVDGTSAEPFNRAAARNDGASKASSDVLVFADADTLYADPDQILHAVETCENGWYRAADQLMLSEATTRSILDYEDDVEIKIEKIWPDAPGGIHVCTREQFRAVGGYDEGFRGWGYEDTAFVTAMNAVNGEARFHGDTIHLWHPKPRKERQGQPKIKFNKNRYLRYVEAAQGGREAMLEHLRLIGRLS